MENDHIFQLLVEPSIFETIFHCLSFPCVCSMESCCTQLRDMVVLTRVYKKRFKKIANKGVEEELTQYESSKYFKKLLSDYYVNIRSVGYRNLVHTDTFLIHL